jgi:hypothetical protein
MESPLEEAQTDLCQWRHDSALPGLLSVEA